MTSARVRGGACRSTDVVGGGTTLPPRGPAARLDACAAIAGTAELGAAGRVQSAGATAAERLGARKKGRPLKEREEEHRKKKQEELTAKQQEAEKRDHEREERARKREAKEREKEAKAREKKLGKIHGYVPSFD